MYIHFLGLFLRLPCIRPGWGCGLPPERPGFESAWHLFIIFFHLNIIIFSRVLLLVDFYLEYWTFDIFYLVLAYVLNNFRTYEKESSEAIEDCKLSINIFGVQRLYSVAYFYSPNNITRFWCQGKCIKTLWWLYTFLNRTIWLLIYHELYWNVK